MARRFASVRRERSKMKKLVFITTVLAVLFMTVRANAANNIDVSRISSYQVIVPYTPRTIRSQSTEFQKVPYYPQYRGIHFVPHIYIGKHSVRGYGSSMGLDYGIYRYHSIRFGVQTY